MKQITQNLITQFIVGVVGGATFGGIFGSGTLLWLFGFDAPSWAIIFVFAVSTLGSLFAMKILKNYSNRTKLIISIASLIIIPLIAGFLAFGSSLEDIDFIGILVWGSITIAVFPSAIITFITFMIEKNRNSGNKANMKIFHLIFIIISFLFIVSCSSIPPEKQCSVDTDCVPDACCHATGTVNKDFAQNCKGQTCTLECRPDTLDCGLGKVQCANKECTVVLNSIVE